MQIFVPLRHNFFSRQKQENEKNTGFSAINMLCYIKILKQRSQKLTMSKHKSRKYRKDEPQTTWEIIKDLFLHPFEYRKKNTNNSIGKFLGGLCIFLALCLLFALSGNNL